MSNKTEMTLLEAALAIAKWPIDASLHFKAHYILGQNAKACAPGQNENDDMVALRILAKEVKRLRGVVNHLMSATIDEKKGWME